MCFWMIVFLSIAVMLFTLEMHLFVDLFIPLSVQKGVKKEKSSSFFLTEDFLRLIKY